MQDPDKEKKPDSKFIRVVKTRSSMTQAAIIPSLFIAMPIAGLLIGDFLDKKLNTAPWLLLLFFILGMVEASRELWKIAKRAERAIDADKRDSDEESEDDE